MLPLVLALAATAAPRVVSTEWLAAHLQDARIRVICTGDRGFDRGHIPGAREIDHMATVGADHRMLPPPDLARVLARAGADDDAHIILYGDSPMTTGWIYMAFAATGHGDQVSWLDGGPALWRDEKRPLSQERTPAGSGQLTVRPAPDIIVDAPWVRERLQSPAVRILDVRTQQEWNDGHLPGATLVLWPDLFADQRTLKLKSPDDIRALLAHAGVAPSQQVVTYCAVGMRASLMYWAARTAGFDARVYLGSWEDWHRGNNPTAR
jgi:thiosulfate/3-mercaptopyruvate sulfurtransferase